MSDVVPTLDCPTGHAVLGEEVLFRAGMRALEGRVSGSELAFRECALVIIAPDGSRHVHARGPRPYDGRAMITSLHHPECLNDLVPALHAGRYLLRYEHAGHSAEAAIALHELTDAARLDVALELPPRLELARQRAVPVTVVITSRSTVPMQLFAPQHSGETSVVGFLESAEPPLFCPLTALQGAPRGIVETAPIELAPGGRLAIAVDLGRDGAVLWDDPTWAPRAAFTVTAGLVLQVVSEERVLVLRLLQRVRIEYASDGTYRGPLSGPVPMWARFTPTMAVGEAIS